MKIHLFLVLLLSLMAVLASCGDESGADQRPPPQQQEEAPENDPDPRPPLVRYSAIQLLAMHQGYEVYEHQMRMELNMRPVIITGHFHREFAVEDPMNRFPVPPATVQETCSFSITLPDHQARHLEKYADRIRYCEVEGPVNVLFEGAIKKITLTFQDGTTVVADKYRYTEPVPQNYICRGSQPFYSYLKKVVRPKLPSQCPGNALRKF